MKEQDLQNLVEENTKDGVIDFKKITSTINDETNNLIAKNQDSAKAELLKTFGVEKPDDLTKKLSEIEEKEKILEEKDNSIKELTQKSTRLEREKALYGMGISDPDRIDYIMFNLDKRIDDETPFDKAIETYKEEKPDLFKSTLTFGNPTKTSDDDDVKEFGFEKELYDKYPDLRED